MLAYNLSRELQMRAAPERRATTPTRPAIFELETRTRFATVCSDEQVG